MCGFESTDMQHLYFNPTQSVQLQWIVHSVREARIIFENGSTGFADYSPSQSMSALFCCESRRFTLWDFTL
jgi:hypothetical protein